jgi:hypothetical protein
VTIWGIADFTYLRFIACERCRRRQKFRQGQEAQRMSFKEFKVLTFDVVGTCIDFEKGILDGVRAIGGAAAAKLSDDDIFAPYLVGREKFPGRASVVMRDVYLHTAKERPAA